MDEFFLIDIYDGSRSEISRSNVIEWLIRPDILSGEISQSDLDIILGQSWDKFPDVTINMICHWRDKHLGCGKSLLFQKGFQWLMRTHPEYVPRILTEIPTLGNWKDLLLLWEYCDYLTQCHIIYFYGKQLQKDVLESNDEHLSPAGKWAPTEKCSLDKKWGFVQLLCEQLGWTRKQYRQRISSLRNRLEVPERLICDKRWGEIEFDRLSQKAAARYHSLLLKHCGRRYQRYLNSMA